MVNEHITSLGYRLEFTDDVETVQPLLSACRLEPIEEVEDAIWSRSQYLIACTRAGGIAACIGWSRFPDDVVVHSLAVAPTSRGSGIGAGLLASAMGHLMDKRPVDAMWLVTTSRGARRLFGSAGFGTVEVADVPLEIQQHPTFQEASPRSVAMARRYGIQRRGLDNCAFRLILNDTPDATLPLGSVFFFRQTGDVIESSYRGGPVVRGHLLGQISGTNMKFCWHQFTDGGRLMQGDGDIDVESLPDGRRELRETIKTPDSVETNQLLLREV